MHLIVIFQKGSISFSGIRNGVTGFMMNTIERTGDQSLVFNLYIDVDDVIVINL